MSFEERNTWIGLVIGIGILAWYGLEIRDAWLAGSYDGPEGLNVWARQVIWVIPVGVGVMIVATVLGHILYGIATGGDALDHITDERDLQIGLWGLRVTLVVTTLTFLAALAGLAWGWTPLVTLNLMFFGFWLGSFVGDLAKVALYHRGG